MQLNWDILRAGPDCLYKAWQLAQDLSAERARLVLNSDNSLQLPVKKITPGDKLAVAAGCILHMQSTGKKIEAVKISSLNSALNKKTVQSTSIKLSKYSRQAQKLLLEIKQVIEKEEPPAFFRNSHCPECLFRDSCYQKLKDRDCISLLSGMSPKVLMKYRNKGISTVTQLSHLFRPKKRMAKTVGNYLWELKALAIREQKTFVLRPPDLKENATSIYLDFEGIPEDKSEYLLGVIIKEENKSYQSFSFWAKNETEEEKNFIQLIELLDKYPDAPIYHYGSYEVNALKQAAKKWKDTFQKSVPILEKRMINLLSFLRTHVYPPTYRNGLKEVGNFLGFHWSDSEANGLLSMEWRNNWQNTHEDSWKEKLIQYNLDDCKALIKVHEWLWQLAVNAESQDNVQQVSKMKKHSPYRLQSNILFSEDFQYINKAAYFDYQRNKVYWRGETAKVASTITQGRKPKSAGKGKIAWKPKKVNQIIVMPRLEACPHCGHKKLYFSRTIRTKIKQTDIKFTASGMRQYVTEYQSGDAKCASCRMKFNNANLRLRHYGDNLLGYATYLYVNFHISNEMVSRLIQEQVGIWISPMYLVMNKHRWWTIWQPEIDYLKQTVLSSPVIHIDETSVKLNKTNGYVWVFATKHTVFYQVTLTREADFLHVFLKDYKGIIVSDFYPGYESLPVKRQKCLVHLIRDLNDDLFKNPFDDEYKNMVNAFGKLLRKIIGTIDRYGLKQKHLNKHLKDTQEFYQEFIECDYKSELSVKCAKRLKRHWDEIWTFLHYDSVPWNNNNAEVGIKAFAMYRRGVNGQVSEKGLGEYLKMLSLSQTCRYRNISFLDFLRCKKGIWENVPPESLPGILPFRQARLFIRKLKFERLMKLKEWEQSGKRPAFIPDNPALVYNDEGWKDWRDWIGV